MALLQISDPDGLGGMGQDEIDSELADRYLIVSQNFIHGLKSRFDNAQIGAVSRGLFPDRSVTGKSSDMHVVAQTETRGLEHALKSLAKFPHFLAPPPRGRKPVDVDAFPIVDCLRDITSDVDKRSVGWEATDSEDFFADGGPTRLFVAFVDLHVHSFSDKVEKPVQDDSDAQNFMSSWSGIGSVTGLYLHSILALWNLGRPMPHPLLCRIGTILKRHLTRDRKRLGGEGGLDRGFWFWKAFTGAMALATAQYAVRSGLSPSSSLSSILSSTPSPSSTGTASSAQVHGGIDDVEVLEEWFVQAIRQWSKAANVRTWEEARAVLSKVVWPVNFPSEPLAIAMWSKVIGPQ